MAYAAYTRIYKQRDKIRAGFPAESPGQFKNFLTYRQLVLCSQILPDKCGLHRRFRSEICYEVNLCSRSRYFVENLGTFLA